MKAILGLLLCYVLFASQCFAIKGGPVYPGGTVNVTGNFAGVLNPTKTGVNALGIFTVSIPLTGLASGSFLIFQSGRTFVGTIQGLADPRTATLKAVVQGIPVVTQTDPTGPGGIIITTLNVHADGLLEAQIKAPPASNFFNSRTLLTGTSSITVTIAGEVDSILDFDVDGFFQSAAG